MTEWLSLYLHYGDAIDPDTLILDAAKIVEDRASDPGDWFFIRYWENGPHLRIRLASGTRDAATPLLSGFAVRTADAGIPVADPTGSAVIAKEVPYVPETIRYGGPDALAINEQIFRVSTAVALKCLPAIAAHPKRRLAMGLDLMLSASAAARRYCSGQAFFEGYHAAWVDMLKTAAAPVKIGAVPGTSLEARLADRQSVAADLQKPGTLSEHWSRELRKACDGFETVASTGMLVSPADGDQLCKHDDASNAIVSMIYSQMHMMNNRIGLSVFEEMALSLRVAQELGSLFNS